MAVKTNIGQSLTNDNVGIGLVPADGTNKLQVSGAATFSSSVTAGGDIVLSGNLNLNNHLQIQNNGISLKTTSGYGEIAINYLGKNVGLNLYDGNGTGTSLFSVNNSGAATFSSSVTATNGLFSGNASIGGAPITAKLNIETGGSTGIKFTRAVTNANFSAIEFRNSGDTANNARIGYNANQLRLEGTNDLILVTNSADRLTINSTGAAAFASSVTAKSLIIGKMGVAYNPILSIGIDQAVFSNSSIINSWGSASNVGISAGTTRNDGIAFRVVTGVVVDANSLPSTIGTTAFQVNGDNTATFSSSVTATDLRINGSAGSTGLDESGSRLFFTRNSTNYITAQDPLGSLSFGTGGVENRFKLAAATGAATFSSSVTASSFIASNGTVRLKSYTVATLPVGVQGDTAYVTDALGFTYNSILTGGGSGVTIAFFDGTNWRAH